MNDVSLCPMIFSVPPQVNLNDLAKKLGVGSGNLRFADEAAMLEKLKVRWFETERTHETESL